MPAATRQLDDLIDQIEQLQRGLVDFETLVIESHRQRERERERTAQPPHQ
jgi:hypothetical protein